MAFELFFLFRYTSGSNISSTDYSSIQNTSCIVELWFKNVGTVCLHMAIFCKLWRAYKVAQFRKNQRILPQHVMWPFVAMMASVIALTIAQSILDPPVWQVISVATEDGQEAPLETIGTCTTSFFYLNDMIASELDESQSEVANEIHDHNCIWIDITNSVLIILSLIVMLAMAYVTRNIPENLSDSHRVMQAVFVGLFVSLFFTILAWVGWYQNKLILMVLSRSLKYFLDPIIFVAFLIVPKMYDVWCDYRIAKERQSSNKESRETGLSGNITSKECLPSGTMKLARATDKKSFIGRGTVYVSGLNPEDSSHKI